MLECEGEHDIVVASNAGGGGGGGEVAQQQEVDVFFNAHRRACDVRL